MNAKALILSLSLRFLGGLLPLIVKDGGDWRMGRYGTIHLSTTLGGVLHKLSRCEFSTIVDTGIILRGLLHLVQVEAYVRPYVLHQRGVLQLAFILQYTYGFACVSCHCTYARHGAI